MPYIRVSCLSGALTAPQKATLAALLVDIVMGQEIEPVTEIGRAATPVFFDEIDARNWFPGGTLLVDHPEKIFFIVEAVVAASFFPRCGVTPCKPRSRRRLSKSSGMTDRYSSGRA